MIENIEGLLTAFAESARAVKLMPVLPSLRHEVLRAPHKPPPRLPVGYAAVYIFSLSGDYGAGCPAGANRVLKVGKVGANSSARFCSQHYLPNSANSNLARSVINEKVLWAYLGISTLDESTVKSWMLAHLERDHIFVPAGEGTEREIERYCRGRLGPVFEG